MVERKTQATILMIVLVLIYPIFSPLFLQIPYSRGPLIPSPQSTPSIAANSDRKVESHNVRKYPGGSTWLNFTDDVTRGKPPDIFVKSSDHQRIVIGAKFFGMWNWTEYHNLSPTKTIRFDTFEMPLTGHRTEIGDPELPMVTRFIEVPRDVDVTVELLYNTSVMLQRNNFVYPYQGFEIPINWSGAPPTYVNLSIVYNPFHLYFYPTNRVQLSGGNSVDPIIIRGHRVVALNIFPVTFSAFTNDSLVYPNMEIALKYDRQATIQSPPANLVSPIFDELLKAIILNYASLAQPYPDSNQPRMKSQSIGAAADYLIITTDAFRAAVEPLAAWKQRKGLLTKIVTVQEITQETSSDAIRTAISGYIENSYYNWQLTPTYILFVGDVTDIPTHYAFPYNVLHGENISSDLPYFTLTYGSYIPNFFYGRLSVDTEENVTSMVNKILNYTIEPTSNPDFYSSIASCACLNFLEPQLFATANFAADFLRGQGYYVHDVEGLLPYWDSVPYSLEDGRILAYYFGHGKSKNFERNPPFHRDDSDGWGAPSFTVEEDFKFLNIPDRMYPLVLSMACNTGWFDGETDQDNLRDQGHSGFFDEDYDCFCEELTRLEENGAIAVIGATRPAPFQATQLVFFGMIGALFPEFIPRYVMEGPLTLGQTLYFGQMWTFSGFHFFSDMPLHGFLQFHLFGDPEMTIYTRLPTELAVEFPEAIGSQGLQSFVVKVTNESSGAAVPKAMVCLQNAEIHEVAYTNTHGHAFFFVEPEFAGELNITVTLDNCRPFLDVIRVTASGAYGFLIPDRGDATTEITFQGYEFRASELVTVEVDGKSFGEMRADGQRFVEIVANLPAGVGSGPVNFIASQENPERTAVVLFGFDEQPDPFIYCQWDSTTWNIDSEEGESSFPRWDNPDIQVRSLTDFNPVGTYNLNALNPYVIDATIHNGAPADATGTWIIFEWAEWGIGAIQWTTISDHWIPLIPGYQSVNITSLPIFPFPGSLQRCVRVRIEHQYDLNPHNNIGTENLAFIYVDPHLSGEVNIDFALLFVDGIQPELNLIDSQSGDLDPNWHAIIQAPSASEITAEASLGMASVTVSLSSDVQLFEERTYLIIGRIGDQLVGGLELYIIKAVPPPPPWWILLLLLVIILIIICVIILIRRRLRP